MPLGQRFTFKGISKMALTPQRGVIPATVVKAALWQDVRLSGYAQRHFFVRPLGNAHYHLRVIVGTQKTTDLNPATRGEVDRAARLLGFRIHDHEWELLDLMKVG